MDRKSIIPLKLKNILFDLLYMQQENIFYGKEYGYKNSILYTDSEIILRLSVGYCFQHHDNRTEQNNSQ